MIDILAVIGAFYLITSPLRLWVSIRRRTQFKMLMLELKDEEGDSKRPDPGTV